MYNMNPFIDLRVGLFHSTGRRSDKSTSALASLTAIRQHSAAYNSWLLIQLNYLIIQDIILTKTRPRLSLDSCMEIKTVWTSSAHLYSYPALKMLPAWPHSAESWRLSTRLSGVKGTPVLLAESKLRCMYYLLCRCLWGTRGLKEVRVKSHQAHNEESVPSLQGTGRGRVIGVISVYAPATESEGSCQTPPGRSF